MDKTTTPTSGNFVSLGIITGDPDTYGRVYVGTNGRGLRPV